MPGLGDQLLQKTTRPLTSIQRPDRKILEAINIANIALTYQNTILNWVSLLAPQRTIANQLYYKDQNLYFDF